MYQESGINPFSGLENKYSEKLRDFLKVNQLLRDEAGTLFIFCFAMLPVTYSNYYVKIHLVAMHKGWEIAWKEWVSHVMFLYLVYVTWYHHWALFKWNWVELEEPAQRVSNISELNLHVEDWIPTQPETFLCYFLEK